MHAHRTGWNCATSPGLAARRQQGRTFSTMPSCVIILLLLYAVVTAGQASFESVDLHGMTFVSYSDPALLAASGHAVSFQPRNLHEHLCSEDGHGAHSGSLILTKSSQLSLCGPTALSASVQNEFLRLDMLLQATTPIENLSPASTPYSASIAVALRINASISANFPGLGMLPLSVDTAKCSDAVLQPADTQPHEHLREWAGRLELNEEEEATHKGQHFDVLKRINSTLPRCANMILGLTIQMDAGANAPQIVVTSLLALHDSQWIQGDAQEFAAVIIGHPVHPDPFGVTQAIPHIAPEMWASNATHPHLLRIVLHAPLQDILAPPPYALGLGILPVTNLTVFSVHPVATAPQMRISGKTVPLGANTSWLPLTALDMGEFLRQAEQTLHNLEAGLFPGGRAPFQTELTASTPLPTQIVAQSRTPAVVSVSVGAEHTCALLLSGTMKCWGKNSVSDAFLGDGAGRLGLGDTQDRGADFAVNDLPAVALGHGKRVAAISAGLVHTCILLEGGGVRCWGGNSMGQLGYGDMALRGHNTATLPAALPDVVLPEAASHVVANGFHSCAILAQSRKAKCWGSNFISPLGYKPKSFFPFVTSPAQVSAYIDIPSPVVDIQIGTLHTCALAGAPVPKVYCWGQDSSVLPPGPFISIKNMAAGGGQLGYGNRIGTVGSAGTYISDLGPVPLRDAPVVRLGVGMFHTCVLYSTGQVGCWGANQLEALDSSNSRGMRGRLGTYDDTDYGFANTAADAPLVTLPTAAVDVCAGLNFACALMDDGVVICWGEGYLGIIGTANQVSPGGMHLGEFWPWVGVQGGAKLGDRALSISCGAVRACAVLVGGALRCWGAGSSGGLGNGMVGQAGDDELPSTTPLTEVDSSWRESAPVPVGWLSLRPAVRRRVVKIDCDVFRCCSVDEHGGVKCWGAEGSHGQLGYAMFDDVGDDERLDDIPSLALPLPATDVAVGFVLACALTRPSKLAGASMQRLICWGANEARGLGILSTSTADRSPTQLYRYGRPELADLRVPGHSAEQLAVLAVGIGYDFGCAIVDLSANNLYCWGSGVKGRRGVNSPSSATNRVPVSGPAVDISAGRAGACAVLLGGVVQCWGQFEFDGGDGALGRVGTNLMLNGAPVVKVFLDGTYACSLHATGNVTCWGHDAQQLDGQAGAGRLGYGSTLNQLDLPTLGYVPIGEAVVDLAQGFRHTCAVLVSGRLQCWGQGTYSSLGYTHTDSVGAVSTPMQIGPSPISAPIQSVAITETTTCIVYKSGALGCFGQDARGSLGSGRGSLGVSLGQTPPPSWLVTPYPNELHLGKTIIMSGMSIKLRVLGAHHEWRSITRVRSCPHCIAESMLSVPGWMLQVLLRAESFDLDIPGAAFQASCTEINTVVVDGNGVCASYPLCTKSVGRANRALPWTQTCTWPRAWANETVMIISAVHLASASTTQPVAAPVPIPAVGGVALRLQGSLWPLMLQSPGPITGLQAMLQSMGYTAEALRSDLNFAITVGHSLCTGARFTSPQSLECYAPPLRLDAEHRADFSANQSVQVFHALPDWPSPLLAPASVQYNSPVIATADPVNKQFSSVTIPSSGIAIEIQGDNFAPGLAEGSIAWVANATRVVLRRRSDAEVRNTACPFPAALGHPCLAGAFGECAIVGQVSPMAITCMLPPFTGELCAQVHVAGQVSGCAFLVAAPAVVQEIVPSELVFTDADEVQDLWLFGSNFGLPTSSFSANLSGQACASVFRANASALICRGIRTAQLPVDGGSLDLVLRMDTDRPFSLREAVQVIGAMELTSVAPLPLSLGGGEATLYGRNFRWSASYLQSPLQLIKITMIPPITSGAASKDCRVTRVADGAVWCQYPPGVGRVHSILIQRLGEHNRTISHSGLTYSPSQLIAVSPQPLLVFPGGTKQTLSVALQGEGFADLGAQLMPTAVQVDFGAVSCPKVLVVNSSMVLCDGLRIPAVEELSSSVAVQIRHPGLWETASLPVPVLGPPQLNAVQPQVVSAAGKTCIALLGVDLWDGATASFLDIWVGEAVCSNITLHSSQKVSCLSPSLQAAGSITPASVTIQTSVGWRREFPGQVLFAEPEVFSISGGPVYVASMGSDMRVNITMAGVSLGEMDQAGRAGRAGQVLFGAVDCSSAGGKVYLLDGGRRVVCSNMLSNALPLPGQGLTEQIPVTLVTNEGVVVQQDNMQLQLVGPPRISRLSLVQVAPKTNVTVFGVGFGRYKDEVRNVSVGGTNLPWEEWSHAGDTSIEVRVPEPASLGSTDLLAVLVEVHMMNGHSSASETVNRPSDSVADKGGRAAGAFDYIVSPRAPSHPPGRPCAYRDSATGGLRIMFRWTNDDVTRVTPVVVWRIVYSESPWFATSVGATVRDVPMTATSTGGVLLPDEPTPQCAHMMQGSYSNSSQIFDVQVLDAPSSPLWITVAAGTAVGDESKLSPTSSIAGPVFELCSASQYLATQFAARSRWHRVVCLPCPEGAVCLGRPYEAVTNAVGSFRADWNATRLLFVPCVRKAACQSILPPVPSTGELGFLMPLLLPASPATSRRAAEQSAAAAQLYLSTHIPSAYLDLGVRGSQELPWSDRAPWLRNHNVTLGSSADGGVPAGSAALTAGCAEGFTGRMCAQCADGFARSGDGGCSRCASRSVVWLAVFGGLIVGLVVLGYLVFSTLQARGKPNKQHVALNKILLTHMQQLGIAAAFPFAWPEALRSLYSIVDAGSSVSTTLVSVDCLGLGSSAFQANAYAQLFMPLMLVAVAGLFWCLFWAIRSRRGRPEEDSADAAPKTEVSAGGEARGTTMSRSNPLMQASRLPAEHVAASPAGSVLSRAARTAALSNSDSPIGTRRQSLTAGSKLARRGARPSLAGMVKLAPAREPRLLDDVQPLSAFIVSSIVIAFLMHLTLTRVALSMLTCDEVAGKRFLVGDYSVDCDDPANHGWMYGVGIPALLIYGGGIPAVGFTVLWLQRKQLHMKRVRETFGFLYASYRGDHWYWEVVVQARKVLLAVTSVFLQPSGAGLQVTVAVSLLSLFAVAQERAMPFHTSMLNALESGSVLLASITLSGGAALLDTNVSVQDKEAVTVALVLGNAVYLCVLAALLLHGVATDSDTKAALAGAKRRIGSFRASTSSSIRKLSLLPRAKGQSQGT